MIKSRYVPMIELRYVICDKKKTGKFNKFARDEAIILF